MSQDTISIVCGILAVVVFALYLMRRSKRKKSQDEEM
jgi:hypothetical protein